MYLTWIPMSEKQKVIVWEPAWSWCWGNAELSWKGLLSCLLCLLKLFNLSSFILPFSCPFLKHRSPWELWLLSQQTYKSMKRTNTMNFVHSLLNSQIPFNSHFFFHICFPCCPFQEREMWIPSCGKYTEGDLSTYQCYCGRWNGIIWERKTIK